MRLALLVLVAAAAAGAGWWWYHRPPAPIFWQGYAEADYVKVGPTQQGLVMEVSVARGDKVEAGAPLFAQDETSDRAAVDQAERFVRQAEEQLANLRASGKATEIQQAEANLADATATAARIGADLARSEQLLRNGNATQQGVDQLRADYRSAQAKVQAAQAALAQLKAPMGRDSEIRAQEASAAAARAALAMAKWRLGQRRVTAPVGGVVADVMVRPGETVTAGAPVVSLLPPQNIFVRFFVPEADLAAIHRGDEVTLRCDRCAAGLVASISFISPQAEYTPPLIYSESSKSKLVFLVEARPRPEEAALINPGEPIEVRPLVVASASGAKSP
jgi:HlyD family secretion protein